MHPPYDTHAENYYYLKQMNKKTKMAVVFADGRLSRDTSSGTTQLLQAQPGRRPQPARLQSQHQYLYKTEEPKEEEDLKKKPR